jgi:hypothetical protein
VLTVTKSTFSGNVGDGGGGILNDVGATLTVTGSTFTGNISLHSGAGALSNDGTLTVINSTFFGNRCAHSCTAGIFNDGVLTVTNSTFSSNMGTPGGIFNFLGSASIKSTILATSMFAPPPFGPSTNCSGAIFDAGYNISDDSTCGFAKTGSANNGDGVNPLLSAAGLANNGGPTQTIALQSGSPAIDAIPVADCTDQASPPNPITTDQRGLLRPHAENSSVTSAHTSSRTSRGRRGRPTAMTRASARSPASSAASMRRVLPSSVFESPDLNRREAFCGVHYAHDEGLRGGVRVGSEKSGNGPTQAWSRIP